MAVQNALDLTATGIITHDGAGVFTGSTVTEGGVLLAGSANSITDTGVLAKGTTIIGDGATSPTLLAVGTDDYVMTAASGETSGVKWAQITTQGEPAPMTVNTISYFSDFMQQDTVTSPFILTATKGAANEGKNNPGVLVLNSTDKAVVCNATGDGDYFGGGEITLFCRHTFSGTLPTTSLDRLLFGFSAVASISAVDRVGFYYDPDLVSSNWILSTVSASTATNTDSGTAMSNSGTWQVLKLVINAAGTSAEFFIDGVSEGTQSTNFPLTTINLLAGIRVSSWPVGSELDYMGYNQVMTGDRS